MNGTQPNPAQRLMRWLFGFDPERGPNVLERSLTPPRREADPTLHVLERLGYLEPTEQRKES